MRIDLSGKVALVTGAGRYVGAEIARTLAEAGADVVVNDIRLEAAEESAAAIRSGGGRAIAAAADVCDFDQVSAMFDRAVGEYGAVDIVVNNAGVPPGGVRVSRFREIARDEWKPLIDINLYGVLNTTKCAIDAMCERGWGRIITISSEAGRVGMGQGLSVYGAAKAAAVAFSRNLAHEVGRDNVTVNCVSLGMMDNFPPREAAVKMTPIRRQGRSSDIASTVCFLASDHASFISGQTVPVNGGYYT